MFDDPKVWGIIMAALGGVGAFIWKVIKPRAKAHAEHHINKILDKTPLKKDPGSTKQDPPQGQPLSKPVGGLPTTSPPEPPPSYDQDEIYRIVWRWSWYLNNSGTWQPFDLKPYCNKCDCEMEIGPPRNPYLTLPAVYRCKNKGCDNYEKLPGDWQDWESSVLAIIERNRRGDLRGEHGFPLDHDAFF